MNKNPNIYEINLRVWIRKFDSDGKPATFKSIPLEYWQDLKDKGIDYVWLMGVWQTCDSVIEECCFQSGLVESYSRALRDFSKEDVIGSPYAINKYEINPALGTSSELKKLKDTLNKIGLKLILDFVPNHFSADSEIIKEHPDIFLQCSENFHTEDPHTFFKTKYFDDKYFAHARDPFFPAWTDTIQVNFFNPEAIKFMTDTLHSIAQYCDGVRCDMAMLVLKNVFHNTWRGVLTDSNFSDSINEFWLTSINSIKSQFKDFLFIAEAYWNLEWELQQLGFDYTYDKKLLDRLKDGTPRSIKDHLLADENFQAKSVRFIENHDEDRAVTSLGIEKSFAAALIIKTIKGMHLFFEGQFVGNRIKLPVQLGREPNEKIIKVVEKFYSKLMSITNEVVFKNGEWTYLDTHSVHPNNELNENIIAYEWRLNTERRIVIVNFSNQTSQCRIKLDLTDYDDILEIFDILHDKGYIRSKGDIETNGLFVELGAWQGHIFSI